MSNYIIPVLILLLFIFCLIKKVPIYDTFTDGAKGAIDLCISIFPCLVAIFWGVELLRVSGLSKIISDFLSPFISFCGMPPEITELLILRPFSGSGSLALLSEIYTTYGADSYISKCASAVMGSSETIFYVAAVYFAGIKQKKLFFAIPIAVFASFIGASIACLMCRFF